MRLAGYIRVSTESQVDAFGKDVQREGIERYATLAGDEVVEWFEEDAVSGKVDGGHRPVMAQIIERADEFDGVIAFDSTRFARRLVVQETLMALLWDADLQVVTAAVGVINRDDEDPTKVLIRQILGVIAEFDHRNTVKRLHSARTHKMAAGGYGGGVTRFGLKVDGVGKSAQLVGDDVELAVIELIMDRHATDYSLQEIADELNRAGHRTKLGKRWHRTQVQRIIRRCESGRCSSEDIQEATG